MHVGGRKQVTIIRKLAVSALNWVDLGAEAAYLVTYCKINSYWRLLPARPLDSINLWSRNPLNLHIFV
jgi:hypothetical protein